jgi:hypothetical protein
VFSISTGRCVGENHHTIPNEIITVHGGCGRPRPAGVANLSVP